MFQTFFRDLFYRAAQYRMKPDGKGYEGRDDLGIYHHFTVAIDTDNIKRVFDDVRDMATDLNTLIYLKLQFSRIHKEMQQSNSNKIVLSNPFKF